MTKPLPYMPESTTSVRFNVVRPLTDALRQAGRVARSWSYMRVYLPMVMAAVARRHDAGNQRPWRAVDDKALCVIFHAAYKSLRDHGATHHGCCDADRAARDMLEELDYRYKLGTTPMLVATVDHYNLLADLKGPPQGFAEGLRAVLEGALERFAAEKRQADADRSNAAPAEAPAVDPGA